MWYLLEDPTPALGHCSSFRSAPEVYILPHLDLMLLWLMLNQYGLICTDLSPSIFSTLACTVLSYMVVSPSPNKEW